jgi:hypothetical protein
MKPQEIIVRVDRNYGNRTVYPVCDTAKQFAELARTTTLTDRTIDIIKKLGYEVKVLCEQTYL